MTSPSISQPGRGAAGARRAARPGLRAAAGAVAGALVITTAFTSPARAAGPDPAPPAPATATASASPEPAATAAPASPAQAAGLDRAALRRTLDAVHEAGMYGLYSQARDGGQVWRGASGVADVVTRRPARPDMRHRVGSITKTFTSVALLRQVERGAVELDAPVSRYLPGLIPGERGGRITVRMLLNHTSHLGDYIAGAFPSLLEGSPASLDANRFRRFAPEELVRLGLAAEATGEPGAVPGRYSNTNYVIAGLLLEKVTGEDAERVITRDVIRRAGLRDTFFPATPRLPAPSSKAYESLYGLIDPPRDYSVYDMSWASTAGALVSTMDDLNRFYRALLRGELIGPERLAEMRTTVPVLAGGGRVDYGLGLYRLDLPCGRFWGHDGGVFGMLTQSLVSEDGRRQLSLGLNRAKYQRLGDDGTVEPSPIDYAMAEHMLVALCGQAPQARSAQPFLPFGVDRVPPGR
ncbi:serine hydrolase domain-containing protein [Nonomuraea rhodomycinica]|uniref:Beta-lactamase family protein n=1 Tax=Nonomuraea rhodomycinica TaxID=1712872 RepID=A0A7Y6IQ29_9ACTN|nr:serine hydrolase domain-containing protein [Nonomuraea rhodomycinica]NUW41798.1 beta-lactamase family protein [Nonomuraea rhodomycinica]